MRSDSVLLTIMLLAGAVLGGAARTQCSTFWSAAAPRADLAGSGMCSTVWDPDGAGPAPQRLVVGGSSLVGGTAGSGQRVMTWDGSLWQSLDDGPGMFGDVAALTIWNGFLVAGGTFSGTGADYVALWDGSAWQALGPGLAFTPTLLTVWNGNLVAATSTLGTPHVATWNGVSWSYLPAPPSLTLPRAMVSFQGLLCVGGTGNGGVLERWNGTSWLASIPANGSIHALAVRSFSSTISSLYAGGSFSTIGIGATSANAIASTGGGTVFAWSQVAGGLPASCLALHVRATLLGTAIVARINSSSAPMLQLSGGSFVPMGDARATSLSFYGSSYHATVSAASPEACLRYEGSSWAPVRGASIVGEVRALAASGPDMIVGGTLLGTAGPALNRIARWNGTTFQPLGAGMTGVSVDALTTLANGDVVAGGLFPVAGGVTVNNIARWNGSAWSAFGTGCDLQVQALCRLPNGDLVAGGRFATAGGVACARIARWNGAAWVPLGLGMNGDVQALAVRSDGTLFAGGAFTFAGSVACNHIACWNGAAWSAVGTGCNGDVHALAVRPNDDVVAAGAFTLAGGVSADRCARWNGSAWAAMGASSGDASPARSVLALPNGDVVAGRGFHQPTAMLDSGIARWNGTAWSGFDNGLAAPAPNTPVAARALAQRADGTLIVGGDFGIAGGLVTRGLATLSPTCPAIAQAYGTGCSSTAGPLALTAETLPWIGAPFRTAATGIAPGSLCLGVLGFSQLSIPLASLLAPGQPGCSLLAAPDVLSLLVPDAAGTVRTTLALAPSPALLGASFCQQAIPVEFNGAGAIVAVRGSNALALTIGTL